MGKHTLKQDINKLITVLKAFDDDAPHGKRCPYRIKSSSPCTCIRALIPEWLDEAYHALEEEL